MLSIYYPHNYPKSSSNEELAIFTKVSSMLDSSDRNDKILAIAIINGNFSDNEILRFTIAYSGSGWLYLMKDEKCGMIWRKYM